MSIRGNFFRKYRKEEEIRISSIQKNEFYFKFAGLDLTTIELALIKACNDRNKWFQTEAKKVLKKIHKQ
jgi:hypothetical protein